MSRVVLEYVVSLSIVLFVALVVYALAVTGLLDEAFTILMGLIALSGATVVVHTIVFW